MGAWQRFLQTKAKWPKVKAKPKVVQNSLYVGIYKLETENGSRSSQGLPTMVWTHVTDLKESLFSRQGKN